MPKENLIHDESIARSEAVIEDANRDFRKKFKEESVEKLKILLAKLRATPLMKGEMDKISIIEEIIAEKEAA